jgi:chaperonin GroES
VLPDSALPKLNEFTVVAVGAGMRTRDGTTVPPTLQVGQRVLIADQFGGQEVKLDNEEFHIFREEDVLGVLHSTNKK